MLDGEIASQGAASLDLAIANFPARASQIERALALHRAGLLASAR